jgi:hypothetical protein
MLIEVDGKLLIVVCPDCLGDNVGESGLGQKYWHCFTSHCSKDLPRDEFLYVVPTSLKEVQVLQQRAD